MSLPRMEATLSIVGLAPGIDQITLALDLDPSRVLRAGEAIVSSRRSRTRRQERKVWLFTRRMEAYTEEAFRRFLEGVAARRTALHQLQADWPELQVKLFLGVFGADANFGFSFEPDTLAILSEIGLLVDFDIDCGACCSCEADGRSQ